jgi:uncharacterized protein (TIGR02145 family)
MDKKSNIWVLLVLIVFILSCCKKNDVPVLTTSKISNISATTATSGGNITDEGSSQIITRGVCWNTNINPTIDNNKTQDGAGAGEFTSNMSYLNGRTTYYVRAYATSSSGTGYGINTTFTTLGDAPTVSLAEASNITNNSATINGIVNANLLSTTVTFEYGTSINYGSTAIATQSPVTGNTDTNVTADIIGLTASTFYHYRIKAVNSLETTYSNDKTFGTSGTITDIDGNIYNTVAIGRQIWMAENLKVTRFADGTPLKIWDIQISPPGKAYCWYDNNISNKDIYGALYTYDAAWNGSRPSDTNPSGIQGACPTGWHLPSDAEWSELTLSLGGASTAGGKLKEAGTSHWEYPNTGATNESGFTALPGGARSHYGTFYNIGKYGSWWSSSMFLGEDFVTHSLSYNSNGEITGRPMIALFYVSYSVRCLKDY